MHLLLRNFRNYRALDLDLPPGITVLHGQNAQGKTNVLEAVYLLATGRSFRASADRELITRCLPDGELPVARVAAEADCAGARLAVEVIIAAPGWSEALAGAPPAESGAAQKRVRINGAPRRLLDLIGELPAVLFTPEDLDLVAGAPAVRRRYLDIMLAQLDPRYARTLARYQRALQQRNHLLKQIGAGQADAGQLAVWDAYLLNDGAAITAQRLSALRDLGRLAAEMHGRLTAGRDALTVVYHSVEELPGGATAVEEVREALGAALPRLRAREIAQGQTLAGPHRDDLVLRVNGTPVSSFGSRGQQRTASLALKLAEAELLRAGRRDEPVLLLDDVLSELDATRRRALSEAARGFRQVLITTADLAAFPPDVLHAANVLRVEGGAVISER